MAFPIEVVGISLLGTCKLDVHLYVAYIHVHTCAAHEKKGGVGGSGYLIPQNIIAILYFIKL